MNIVITGSTKGLGYALSKEFLNNGDNVIITSRNIVNVNNAVVELSSVNRNSKIYQISSDVSDPKECKKLVDFSFEIFDNDVDIWINNAASCAYSKKMMCEFDEYEINDIIETNLFGTINCCKYLIPKMKKNGTIINLEGAGSNGLPTNEYSIYGASKAGIYQFTNTIQLEYPNLNIYTISLVWF